MYRTSKWKLALIIMVFLLSALYLLPSMPGVYSNLFGFLDIRMQDYIPLPDVGSSEDGAFIRFDIPQQLPKGVSIDEAIQTIENVVERRLSKLGMEDNEFSFDDVEKADLYIDFNETKSKADLEDIISKLQPEDAQPLVQLPPVLPDGEDLGSIKFTVTHNDFAEAVNMQETLADLKDKLIEQLETLEMSIGTDFSFTSISGRELLVKFGSQKSNAEMEMLLENLHLYGSLPRRLRPIFPDKPLKQGLDLKGGLHIVLELDEKKAVDAFLDGRAKDIIQSSLRSEKIFCKRDGGVVKTLEKVGDNLLILRIYPPEDSTISRAQYVADMKRKLVDQGFSTDNMVGPTDESPQIAITMNIERSIGDLVNNILGGINPLIVTITVPSKLQGADREDYIDTAEKTLDRLELFDKPRVLQEKENMLIFSVQVSGDNIKKLIEDNMDTVMQTLENKINEFGVAESTIRRVRGKPRILIQIPEEQNPTETLRAIKEPGVLKFKLVKANPLGGTGGWYISPGQRLPSSDELPPGAEIRKHVDGGWFVLDSKAFLEGSTDLKSNSATVTRGQFGSPQIIMYLTPEGQRKFSDFTEAHVNERTAILLDDVVQSAPNISEKISTRSARISGDFTVEEADYLARILRAGAFSAPMKSAEERIVGPTLGQAAINRGKLAFAIGISLVIVFMLIYYKWSGVIAVVALLFNFLIILGVLAGFGATLTLPGMAGLILTIGISVDANVLIFERIRDEIRSGKTVRSSIDSGYQKAFWTILDANVTTFLTALVLYEFGTGPIKGFAVTLSIGIGASMFTALVVTREIYRWAYRRRTITKLSI